jgi:hypothetical protein
VSTLGAGVLGARLPATVRHAEPVRRCSWTERAGLAGRSEQEQKEEQNEEDSPSSPSGLIDIGCEHGPLLFGA